MVLTKTNGDKVLLFEVGFGSVCHYANSCLNKNHGGNSQVMSMLKDPLARSLLAPVQNVKVKNGNGTLCEKSK